MSLYKPENYIYMVLKERIKETVYLYRTYNIETFEFTYILCVNEKEYKVKQTMLENNSLDDIADKLYKLYKEDNK